MLRRASITVAISGLQGLRMDIWSVGYYEVQKHHGQRAVKGKSSCRRGSGRCIRGASKRWADGRLLDCERHGRACKAVRSVWQGIDR